MEFLINKNKKINFKKFIKEYDPNLDTLLINNFDQLCVLVEKYAASLQFGQANIIPCSIEKETKTLWLAYNFMVGTADINQQWSSDFILTFGLDNDKSLNIAKHEEIEIREADLKECFNKKKVSAKIKKKSS